MKIINTVQLSNTNILLLGLRDFIEIECPLGVPFNEFIKSSEFNEFITSEGHSFFHPSENFFPKKSKDDFQVIEFNKLERLENLDLEQPFGMRP